MRKSFLSVLFIIVLTACVISTPAFCFAETRSDDVNEFYDLLEKMQADYDRYINESVSFITTTYYGYINRGNELLKDENVRQTLSDESIDLFHEYSNYYYRQKTLDRMSESYIRSNWCVSIDGNIISFYSEQWEYVETVYNAYVEKVSVSSVGTDYDDLFREYLESLLSLDNKSTADKNRYTLVADSVKRLDTAVVDKINESLSSNNLPIIDMTDYLEYRWNDVNDDYDRWFTRIVLEGFSDGNLVAITALHSVTISKIEGLSIFAEKSAYDLIISDALSDLEKIKVNHLQQNDYLLSTAKESAYLTLDSFVESEIYSDQKGKVKKTFDRIIQKAKEDISNAETIDQVQKILAEAQDNLASVDTTDKSWIAVLTVGIVLFIVAIIIAILFARYDSKKKKTKEKRKLLHGKRLYAEKQIKSLSETKGDDDND